MSAPAVLHEFDPDRDLVLEDGVPLETWYHRLQMVLFLELVSYRMEELGRDDFFANGDMFLYYSKEQAAQVAAEEEQLRLFEEGFLPEEPEKKAYRGPDAFLVKGGVANKKRDVWKVWEEDDRYPDLILELLSPSTSKVDYGVKKALYQDHFQTSEYFLYAPDAPTFDGYRLLDHAYQSIPRSSEGRRWSRELEVEVGIWQGTYERQDARWLRLFYPDGSLVPTKDERAEMAETRAEEAETRAEMAETRAEMAETRAEEAETRAQKECRDKEAAEARARDAELELARLRALYGNGK